MKQIIVNNTKYIGSLQHRHVAVAKTALAQRRAGKKYIFQGQATDPN